LCEESGKNGHIWPIISVRARLILTTSSALTDKLVGGMIILSFVLRSLKGRCYDNQLIWGAFCKRLKLTTVSLCSGVPKRNAISPSA